jgi:plastocyanin
MNKGVMAGLVIALVVVLVGGYLLMNRGTGNTTYDNGGTVVEPTAAVVEEEPADGAVVEESDANVKVVVVEGNKFRFSPAEIRVKKGQTVRIVFKSVDMLHDFVIDELEVATNQIGAGEEEEIEFVADRVGTFEYYCSVGKHRANGMVGKLIVE